MPHGHVPFSILSFWAQPCDLLGQWDLSSYAQAEAWEVVAPWGLSSLAALGSLPPRGWACQRTEVHAEEHWPQMHGWGSAKIHRICWLSPDQIANPWNCKLNKWSLFQASKCWGGLLFSKSQLQQEQAQIQEIQVWKSWDGGEHILHVGRMWMIVAGAQTRAGCKV